MKIALRTMWKYRTQSIIGIFGLAFGLACFIPALYWLRYETSYDNFYPESDQIYRIFSFDKQTGKTNTLVSGILEKKLHEQFPVLQNSTLFFMEQNNCSTQEIPYIPFRTLYTDSTFWGVFPQQIVGGDRVQPLQVTNSIVLTETMAIRLFGNVEKAIGQPIKSITLADDPPYTVTAVVKDPPPDTNLPFDAILSHEQLKMQKSFAEKSGKEIWTFAFLQMYAKLPPHTDMELLAEQLRNYPTDAYANVNMELRMLPVSDVRYQLTTDMPFTLHFIRLFLVAGILLLFSAFFNFMYLHFHLSFQRMREWRLRAVNGASRSRLIGQMLFELLCAVFPALVIACCFIFMIRPAFSDLLGIRIGKSQWMSLFIVCALGVSFVALFVGFILFLRSAFLATRFRSETLKTRLTVWQRLPVSIQLGVSVVFIVATLVVMMQMRFVNRKDLGFDRNGILYLSGLQPFMSEEVRVALMEELAYIPQIEKITDTDFTPQHTVNPFTMTTNVEWPGKRLSEKPTFNYIQTDSRFAETFRVSMMKGRWLDEGGDHEIVLNEEAVRVMELHEPIGAVIRLNLREMENYRVVGVVKDFHTLSLRSRIHPSIFMASKYPVNNLYIRTVAGREQDAMRRINTILPDIDPAFADVRLIPLGELYDRLNYSEQAGLKMFFVLAAVCLLITLFGIYATTAAATQRRRKEIAIRKVMGAGVSSIVAVFFREHILQVLLAGIIALPLAYMAMNNWLQGYAYRTYIPWWLGMGVIAGVITVVLLTVWGRVWRAANANPAQVIKNE